MKPLRAFPTLVITTAALALAAGPATAASPEIISRLDGPSGTPFPAGIAGVADDGRFVILSPKSVDEAAQLGVPQPADPDKTYLRDRTAGTTTELALRTTPGGAVADADVSAISADATRVLFFTEDEDVLELLGLPVSNGNGTFSYAVVADREGGNLWVVRDAKGDPVYASPMQLSDDGSAVLFTAEYDPTAQYAGTSIQRAHRDAPTEVVLSRPDRYPYAWRATGDLKTILYSRDLTSVTRPPSTGYTELTSAGSSAIGLITPQGARIIAQGETIETRVDPTKECGGSNIRRITTHPVPTAISADGKRVSYVLRRDVVTQSPGDEGQSDGWKAFVAGPGGVKQETAEAFSGVAGELWPRTLGATHDLYAESFTQPQNWDMPTLDDYGLGFSVKSASTQSFVFEAGGRQNIPVSFADGDRTVLWSSLTQSPFQGQTPPASEPYAYAESVPGTLPASGSGTSLWEAGIPDTQALTAKVTWPDCLAETSPVGPFNTYAPIALRSPQISSASAGTVRVNLAPAGYRTASKASIEIKLFGLSYWRKTVTTTQDVVLPKPPLWLPLTLTVSVTPNREVGGPTPKPLTETRGVFASR